MFRSRRSTLVKRLWKSRILDSNETSCSNEIIGRNGPRSPLLHVTMATDEEAQHVKAVAQSMLKRLKEKQLEELVEAVESRGGENTGCMLLPRDSLHLGRHGNVAPHVLCCQIWRWPELSAEDTMKRLPCCTADDPTSVCCNPYHWSLRVPESPPPCYRLDSKPRVFIKTDVHHETSPSTELGGTPSNIRADGSSSTSNSQFWCNLAYWELRQRVGRLFAVFAPNVCVFQQLARGDGMCLGVLQSDSSLEAVRRTREKIGHGMVLSCEADGLWMYNRSEYPIFVNSPTLEIPESHAVIVKKVQPGYSLNIFDFELSEELRRTRDPKTLDGPYDPNSIRISFAKGWGPSYSRQFITSCPCWLEVLLSVNR